VAITFQQFFSAIVQQESGGDYNAKGVMTSYGRAYGKYQVLESNIPGWTKAYYGKSLTTQQFLNNHAAQDAVARGKLQSYWNKYGARGAAAAWYGGPGSANLHMSTASQQGGPSIKKYVDDVMNNAAGYPTGGSQSNFSTGSVVAPKLSEEELAEQYGFTSSFLNANPEIKDLFKQMVAGTWAKEKFQAKLRNTKWWKTHNKDERDYLVLRFTDPATAKQAYQQARTKVIQLASQMGMEVNGSVRKYIDAATYAMVARGWDEGQLRYYLGSYVSFPKEMLQGEGGEAINEMRQYAYSMGVNLADSWYTARARNVLRGKATLQDYKSEIMNKAKAAFPQWNKQIEAGQSVADIAQPYMQSMSQVLELPSGSVNLFDSTIKKALSYTNPGTLQKEAKPLWQFENELRADPRWKKTKNAQDSLFQVGHQVLADFGFKH
jgi:hypothetical protein